MSEPNPDSKKMNDEDVIKEAKQLCSTLRKAASKTQWRVAKKIFGTHRHFCIREFIVIDGTKCHGVSSKSLVYHVAGGIWKGYDIQFEELVEFLNLHPEKDEELIMSIFSV
jgi:hypothetical protein